MARAGSSVRALVTGGTDYGEADRIVHLLTREQGRLSAFAHAARKSRKRFGGALEPLTTITALIEPPHRGTLSTLGSAVVESARLPLRDDLGKLALAAYVAELAAAVAPEGAEAGEILDLAERVLDHLLTAHASAAVRRAYELILLDAIGYGPDLEACTACGARPASGEAFLDLHQGGLRCEEHRGDGRLIGPKTTAWMAGVLRLGAAFDPTGGVDPTWAERAAEKAAAPLTETLRALIGHPLRSAALLDDLTG